MCGIAGSLSLRGAGLSVSSIVSMSEAISHRGPDDEGYLLLDTSTGRRVIGGGAATPSAVYRSQQSYCPRADIKAAAKDSGSYNLSFCSRRLAIIDLSPAGHQPMTNEDGSLWIAYNGEVYNHDALRRELSANHVFQSRTDTEVILHAYEQWGADCLSRFNGMWAFAIWDARKRELFCSRDRFGVKPFYYSWDGTRLVFSSEMKAILKASGLRAKPDDSSVHDYLIEGLVDHRENTFFEGIRRLMPGHYFTLSWDGSFQIKRYYDIPTGRRLTGLKETEYDRRFLELFEDSVRLRLVSDVPVGTCLSGGLDSSSVVCVMDKLMRQKGLKLPGGQVMQKTFSACYRNYDRDELKYIEKVREKVAVESHLVYPTGERLLGDMERLVRHQEEPFGSTSIYAQWEVFKLLNEQKVKVALDGQGADETLAGYPYYFPDLFADLLRQGQFGSLAREFKAYRRLDGGTTGALLVAIYKVMPAGVKRLIKGARGTTTPAWINTAWVSGRPSLSEAVPAGRKGATFLDAQLYRDATLALLPAELRFEDKNSMAHSVEARLPFLDYRMVEFVFSLPWEQIIYRGETKYVLRQAMSGILPEAIRGRHDKIGFSTPEAAWFKTSLRGLAEGIVNSDSFNSRPYFVPARAREGLAAYLEGRQTSGAGLWSLVNLELWLRAFVD